MSDKELLNEYLKAKNNLRNAELRFLDAKRNLKKSADKLS